MPNSSHNFKYVSKSKDLPATQGMLHLVRSELKSDVRELRSEMKAGFKQMESKFDLIDSRFNQIDSRFNQIDSKFSQIDSKFNQIDSRFNQTDSKFHGIDAKFEKVLSEIARVGILVEEQNSRNQVVLEGLTGLWERQERVEGRVDRVEEFVKSVIRPKT